MRVLPNFHRVTHLEGEIRITLSSFCWRRLIRHAELAFWLFLLHQGPGKRNWFHSWEFRTWYMGMNLHSKLVSPFFDNLHESR